MGPNKQHIDKVIREKLEGLEAGYDPGSWDLLAHRMDFDAQQAVDGFFKNRLENIGAAIPPNDWDAFEKVLDANESTESSEAENQFDDVAYEKLNDLEASFRQHHWSLMAKRLEEEFSIRHQLYRYKVAEIVLMALLLLTVFRFMPLLEKWQQPAVSSDLHPPVEQPQRNISADPTTAASYLSMNMESEDAATGNTVTFTAKKHHLLKSKKGHALIPSVLSGSPLQALKNTSSDTGDGLTTTSSGWATDPVNPLPAKKLTLQPPHSESQSRVAEITSKKLKQQQFLAAKRHPASKPLATLPIEKVSASFAWELPAVKTIPARKKNDLRFSIFTTTDVNYVTTPPDQISVFGEPVQTGYNETLASGYGGGVNISFKRNRWEYQTGGIYSFKRYIPNTPIFIFETLNFYIKEDFNGIQLDIFQVPLNALYHFKNSGKWRLYASAGVSAHFVTSTIYEFDVQKESLNPPTEGNRNSSPDDTKSIKQQKDFPDGLLDGGQLQDNFYMSANIGLGAEYYLSPKWTIFFQPNYQHFMMSGGIGTNRDKIYTTSLYLGTKFNLK